MAKEPTPPDQAGKEAITEEQQPQKKGSLLASCPWSWGWHSWQAWPGPSRSLCWSKPLRDSLKGVLVESSAEGGNEEKTANEGEPSEDGGQASRVEVRTTPMPVTAMPPVAMDMGVLERRTRTNFQGSVSN